MSLFVLQLNKNKDGCRLSASDLCTQYTEFAFVVVLNTSKGHQYKIVHRKWFREKRKATREKEETARPLLQVSAGHEMDRHKHMDFGAPNHTVKRHIAVVAI